MTRLDGPRAGPASTGPAQQLVVICHGVGADGHDLIDLAASWRHALPHAAFAAPDGPQPYDMAPMGRQWFSLAHRDPAILAAGARAAAPHLDRFIDAELGRLGLPETAYALVGFSQGAMMALFAGLRRAAAPRCILAYSGALLGAETLAAEARNRAPVLLAHGEMDEVVPSAMTRRAAQALQAAGVPVETLFCPRLGHGIDDAGIAAGALCLQRAFA